MKDFLFFAAIAGAFSVISFIFPCQADAAGKTVVINELMPNPPGTDTGNEWIELYNDSDQKINLLGWQIKDKTGTYTIGDLNIDPGSYLVIFPSVSLNNSDEIITLLSPSGYTDEISYSTSAESISLERINPQCTNLKPHSSSHSKGKINENFIKDFCNGSPQVKIQTRKTGTVEWNEDHSYFHGDTFETGFELDKERKIEKIIWSYEGKISSDMEAKFTTTINANSTLEVEIFLENNEKIRASIALNIYPHLKLNEIFPDPKGADSGSEWIEIYNPNGFQVDLKGWTIKIGSKKQLLDNLILAPKGFGTVQTIHALTNTGTEISLVSPSGSIADKFSYSTSEEDLSWARSMDGAGEWIIQEATKAASNLLSVKGELYELQPETETERSYSILSQSVNVDLPQLFRREAPAASSNEPAHQKFFKANIPAFGIFFAAELSIYIFLILSGEERAKLISAIKKTLNGNILE